ncbi:hypothetical protein AB1E18_000407 [Capra hircus]
MNAERDSPKFSQEVLSGDLYGVHGNIITAFSWAFSYDHPARGEYISMKSGLLERDLTSSYDNRIIEFRLLPSETQPTLLINLQGCDGGFHSMSAVERNGLEPGSVSHGRRVIAKESSTWEERPNFSLR